MRISGFSISFMEEVRRGILFLIGTVSSAFPVLQRPIWNECQRGGRGRDRNAPFPRSPRIRGCTGKGSPVHASSSRAFPRRLPFSRMERKVWFTASRRSETVVNKGKGLPDGLFRAKVHSHPVSLAVAEKGHELGRVSLEGDRVDQGDLSVDHSETGDRSSGF